MEGSRASEDVEISSGDSDSSEGLGKGQGPKRMLEVKVGMVNSSDGVEKSQGPRRML